MRVRAARDAPATNAAPVTRAAPAPRPASLSLSLSRARAARTLPVLMATLLSSVSAAEKLQQPPQPPWSLTLVTTLGVLRRQSSEAGSADTSTCASRSAACVALRAASMAGPLLL